MGMTAFDTAWDLLKVDFSLPKNRPSYFSPNAELAVVGSRNAPDREQIPDYRTGDFGEAMRDGRYGIYDPVEDIWHFSQEDGRDVGIEDVFGELERASLVNAIVGSPLSRHRSVEPSDEKWLEDIIEEVFNAGGRYVPMESGKGQFMRRTHQQSPSVADFARSIGMEWPDEEDKGDFIP